MHLDLKSYASSEVESPKYSPSSDSKVVLSPRRKVERKNVTGSTYDKRCNFCTLRHSGIFKTIDKIDTSFIRQVAKPENDELVFKMKALRIQQASKSRTSSFRSQSSRDFSRFLLSRKSHSIENFSKQPGVSKQCEEEKCEKEKETTEKICEPEGFIKFLNKKHHKSAIKKLTEVERQKLKEQIDSHYSRLVVPKSSIDKLDGLKECSEDQKLFEKVTKVKASFEKVQKQIQKEQDAELMFLILQGTDEDRKLLSIHSNSILKMENLFLIVAKHLKKTELCTTHLFNLLSFMLNCCTNNRFDVVNCRNFELAVSNLETQPNNTNYCVYLGELRDVLYNHQNESPNDIHSETLQMPPFLEEVALNTKRSKSKEKRFANQMMELQRHLYNSLQVEDLALEKSKESDAVSLFTRYSKNITKFIAHAILKTENLEERGQKIRFFLNVCKRCLKNGDVASTIVIFHALGDSSITRLKKSFNVALSFDNNRVFFEELDSLCSPLHNFRSLRAYYETRSKSLTPAYAVFLREYELKKEAGAIVSYETKRRYNYEKIYDAHHLIEQYLHWQEKPKHNEILKSPFARYFLQTLPDDDPNTLYEQSLRLEPIIIAL